MTLLGLPCHAASTLADLSNPPAGAARSQTKIGRENTYGRIRLPSTKDPKARTVIAVGDTAKSHYRMRIEAGRFTVLKAMGNRSSIITSGPLTTTIRTIEFSRRGRRFVVYTPVKRLWSVDDVTDETLSLIILSPSPGARIRIQAVGDIVMDDDFMRKTIGKDDAWFPYSGHWRSLFNMWEGLSPNPFVCQANAVNTSALLVTGYLFWNNARLSVGLRPRGCREVGIVFAYRDEKNFCKAVLIKQSRKTAIVAARVENGIERILGRKSILYPGDRWSQLAVQVSEDKPIALLLDEVPLLSLALEENCFGKVGLLTHNGVAWFDDFSVRSLSRTRTPPLRRIGSKPSVYAEKEAIERKPKADRQLFRWAKNHDAWHPVYVDHRGVRYVGSYYQLPLFGDLDFIPSTRHQSGVIVVLDWLGKPMQTFSVNGRKRILLSRRNNALLLDGKKVGTVDPHDPLMLGWASRSQRPSAVPGHVLRSNTLRQDVFAGAPVWWMPVSGTWKNTSRWQCDPRWCFFSGYSVDEAVLFSKHTYEGNQVHELYFGMKDLFAREYEMRRYGRRDVNFSFLTDGKNVFSGYTFLYGGFNNTASYLYRGTTCVAVNKKIKFKPFDKQDTKAAIYDQHLFWHRARFEKIGRRIRVFFESQEVFDYEEEEPLKQTGGHIALWTHRNGVMYGRVESSAEHSRPDAGIFVLGSSGENNLPWQPLPSSRVDVEASGKDRVKITNRFGGGEIAVRYNMRRPVDLSKTPRIKLWMKIPEDVKVNLHFKVNGEYFVHALTAPLQETYRVLGNKSVLYPLVDPPWKLFVSPALKGAHVGGKPKPTIKDAFELDLLQEMKRRRPGRSRFILQEIIIGNTSHKDYLMSGLTGNAAGSAYKLGKVVFE